jgi:lipooligosaccharide transport system permease protein
MLRAFSYWLLRYRRTWRGSIVISVANPLLFLLGVGAGIGHLVDRNMPAQIAGVAYAAFFAPGMLAAAAMQTAFLESAGPVYQAARQGSYRSATPTPLEPSELLNGHLLYIVFRVLTSSASFIVVMAAFGVSDGWWALALIPASLLTGLAFAAPTAAWAVTVRQPRHINTVFRFVILPLYMFSGTFFAISQLPDWLRPVVYATPLWQGVDLCRSLSLGDATPATTLMHVAYLLVFTVAGLLLARASYRRILHM